MKNENGVVHAGGETTRRAFVGGVARKAAYLAPAVLALGARTAHAATSVTCIPLGSPCLDDFDCCSTQCGSNGKCRKMM